MKKIISNSLIAMSILMAGCSTSIKQQSPTLSEARKGFETEIVRSGEDAGAPQLPDSSDFQLIQYPAAVGKLAAYITIDPGDGRKHPAIIWITGGDNNTISDVWTPQPRNNDQTASAFRKAGIVMMFPSQRGGNNNPGQREGFYGEVDDILAAAEYLKQLSYVDPDKIYLGGHSTGGTMAMLVGESSNQFQAVFSLGPVASPVQYGNQFLYADPNNEEEMILRSPIYWMQSVKNPMYVFEGENNGNWDSIQSMKDINTNPQIEFFKVSGHDHFTVITPVTELLAQQIIKGEINITQKSIENIK